MKFFNNTFLIILVVIITNYCSRTNQEKNTFNIKDFIIRIAEIEIDSNNLNDYISLLKEESEASVRLEPGVISIYPMYQKDEPTRVRILEIYADWEAYESHLKTPHFQKYKTSTANMVKSLKLIDMEAIDEESMSEIFVKLQL